MFVTVAICTRNRASSLTETLSSLARMNAVGRDWEVLVVDNASSDNTPNVVRAFAERLPVRYEAESRPGLSSARNRAVTAARGSYIAWTDDDVVVDPDWLCAYARAFVRWPEASIFGGRITPVLREPCAAWFRKLAPHLGPALAARNLGDQAMPLVADQDRLPFGANYAVRAADQRRFPYDLELGVSPERLRVGEETFVLLAMMHSGCTGWWLPDCRVDHIIGAERQNTRYIKRYFAASGSTAAHRDLISHKARLGGVPRWLWRRAFERGITYVASRATSPPEVWISKLIAFAEDRGRIEYYRSLRNGR